MFVRIFFFEVADFSKLNILVNYIATMKSI